jgi:hypothetical protein
MEDLFKILHEGLTNAYILFSIILGVYAGVLAGQNKPISGNFWGAMWTNTFLAGAMFIASLILLLFGVQAERIVYYLYGLYFVISLPGVFAIQGGTDDRRSAFIYGVVGVFNGLAAYRAITVLW